MYISSAMRNKTEDKRNRAIEIIIGMKRYYAQKSDKHLIDKEVQKLAKEFNITYGDVSEYKEKIKNKEIIPYWK